MGDVLTYFDLCRLLLDQARAETDLNRQRRWAVMHAAAFDLSPAPANMAAPLPSITADPEAGHDDH